MNGWHRDTGDYVATVEAPLSAGANAPEVTDDLEASDLVRDLLRRHAEGLYRFCDLGKDYICIPLGDIGQDRVVGIRSASLGENLFTPSCNLFLTPILYAVCIAYTLLTLGIVHFAACQHAARSGWPAPSQKHS